MKNIIGISGSLRKGSFNTLLLRAAAAAAPPDCKLELATLVGIPLYDGDLEASEGIPKAVTELKERIIKADGVVIATPEYNNSIPGVLKNAIDWLSRPGADIPRVFGDKPIGLMGATPGPGGTRLSQAAWLPVLRLLGSRIFTTKGVYVANAGQLFDANGTRTDEKTKEVVRGYMDAFSAFAKTTL